MKSILIVFTILLTLGGCKDRTKYIEVLSYEVDVKDPIQFNYKSGETVIKMGKVVHAENDKKTRVYQYFIEARKGTWIETNKRYYLGDTLILGGVRPTDPSGETTIMFSEIKVNPKKEVIKKEK
jgi:hypothetical protein